MAFSEIRSQMRASSAFFGLVALASASPALAQPVASLPDGGSIVRGSAVISSTENSITVTQDSARAIIDWNSFDIADGNSVTFVQPDTNSAILNRVTGTTGSTIAGQITANGSVFLINPNGIQITSTGTVNVGSGFVASTYDILDDEFMSGIGALTGEGGYVVNNGQIVTGNGGYVGLIGAEVVSSGYILAPKGEVVIGAGKQAVVDLEGDGFLQLLLPESAFVSTNGESVAISRQDAYDARRAVVNTGGLEATNVSGVYGNVTLGGTISTTDGSVFVSAASGVDFGAFDISALDANVASIQGITLDGALSFAGGNLTLRADESGSGVGTITGSGSLTNSGNNVDFIYNPLDYLTESTVTTSGPITHWYLVNTISDLSAIETNMTANYMLGRDIDLENAPFKPIGSAQELDTIFDGNLAGAFQGVFDGDGHVISNLNIAENDYWSYSGLFRWNDGVIKNVGINGVTQNAVTFYGPLAAVNRGTVDNVFVTGGSLSGRDYIGGIIGFNFGSISNAWSDVDITGGRYTGGITAVNSSVGSTQISNVYVLGANLTPTGDYNGAVVGIGFGTITNVIFDESSGGATSAIGAVGQSPSVVIENVSSVTSDSERSGETNYIGNATAWSSLLSVDTSGGQAAIWRLYEGQGAPLLKAFLQTAIINLSTDQITYDGLVHAVSPSVSAVYGEGELADIYGAIAAISGTDAGVYTIDASTLYSTQYDIVTGVAGSLIINPRELAVLISSTSREYGNANPSLTYSIGGDGLVGSDTVTGSLVTDAEQWSDAGDYTISSSELDAGSNYVITGADGVLSVVAAPVTVTYTADDASSTYGDAAASLSGTYAISGEKRSEDLASLLDGDAIWTSEAGSTSDAGSYAIIGIGLSSSNGNYTVSFVQDSANADAYTITPRPITITADDVTRTYGEANSAFTYSVGGNGLVNGDSLSGALASMAEADANVGAYDITQGSLVASSNYAVTFINGALTIEPAALQITYQADPASSVMGEPIAELSGGVSAIGLLNGDTIAEATSGSLSFTTEATSMSLPGSYAIEGEGLVSSGNYTITFAQAAENASAYTVQDAVSAEPSASRTTSTESISSEPVSGETSEATNASDQAGTFSTVDESGSSEPDGEQQSLSDTSCSAGAASTDCVAA